MGFILHSLSEVKRGWTYNATWAYTTYYMAVATTVKTFAHLYEAYDDLICYPKFEMADVTKTKNRAQLGQTYCSSGVQLGTRLLAQSCV